jgi:hypothetical protein
MRIDSLLTEVDSPFCHRRVLTLSDNRSNGVHHWCSSIEGRCSRHLGSQSHTRQCSDCGTDPCLFVDLKVQLRCRPDRLFIEGRHEGSRRRQISHRQDSCSGNLHCGSEFSERSKRVVNYMQVLTGMKVCVGDKMDDD